MCTLQKHIYPKWWHRIHWIKDLHWSFRRECCKRPIRRERTVLRWNSCIPVSITQFFHCLWHRNSMWQWTSSSSQHFHQCCFQVLNVRHRVWFSKWLTDVSGRWRWSSILVRLGKIVSLCPIHCCSGNLEKIASSYCIYFFLEKKKRCYYLDFCLSERILSFSPPYSLCYH